jgi:hypothetical protein
MAKAGMLDIASVTADVVGRSGLGQDFDAEDMDTKVDADDEIVGDGGAENQAVVCPTGRRRTKTAMSWNLMIL